MRRRAGCVAANGVGQHVQPAKTGDGNLHPVLHRVGIGGVDHPAQHVLRRSGQIGEQARQAIGRSVSQHQLCARCLEAACHCGAQIA
jgi:hypothetical protein